MLIYVPVYLHIFKRNCEDIFCSYMLHIALEFKVQIFITVTGAEPASEGVTWPVHSFQNSYTLVFLLLGLSRGAKGHIPCIGTQTFLKL
jgi:hypothetical protein